MSPRRRGAGRRRGARSIRHVPALSERARGEIHRHPLPIVQPGYARAPRPWWMMVLGEPIRRAASWRVPHRSGAERGGPGALSKAADRVAKPA